MKARVMVCRAIGRGLDRARQEPIADGRGTAGIRLGDHVDAVTNTLGRPFKIEAFGIKGSTTHGHRLRGRAFARVMELPTLSSPSRPFAGSTGGIRGQAWWSRRTKESLPTGVPTPELLPPRGTPRV